ncbi:SDR family NAD(P)-dependent oxidoreductase [Nannocystaceae bacterium ST9]
MVTGASSGIGAAFASRLAAAGFDLVLVARREGLLESLAARLADQYSVSTSFHVADLSDPAQLETTEARLLACPNLALLINSAGTCQLGQFGALESAWVDAHLRLNALAPARLAHAALRKFAGRGPAAIINVSSIASVMTTPYAASYCATKSYLSTLTACIAGECAGTQVRVQDLRAGLTRTEFPAQSGARVDMIPGAAWAEPEEVVESSIRALGRNQVVCFPRAGDRFVPNMIRLLPRRLAREVGKFNASGAKPRSP